MSSSAMSECEVGGTKEAEEVGGTVGRGRGAGAGARLGSGGLGLGGGGSDLGFEVVVWLDPPPP